MTTPAEKWRNWQNDLWPRPPLVDFIEDDARYHAEQVFLVEAHGEGWIDWLPEMEAAVSDLVALARERGVTLCTIAEIGRR